jgi:thymidylate kinase
VQQQGSFITIHGIDGTGKSTTVSMVASLLVARGVATINYDVYESEHTNPFSPAKKGVLATTTPEAQFAFYIGSTLYHSQTISELVAQGTCVVKTRYLDDVLAHHAHLGVANVREIAALLPIKTADLMVVLTLPETVRRARILKRGELDVKDKEVRQAGSRLDFFERFLLESAGLLQSSKRSLIIDTSTTPPERVARMIVERMQEIGLVTEH